MKIFAFLTTAGGGGGTEITVVDDYAALLALPPTADTFYWCQNSQGTAWLPGSLGGSFYPKGIYYCFTTSPLVIEFIETPYQATQVEVDAGTVTDKFVSPKTLTDSAQLSGKVPYIGATADVNLGTFHLDAAKGTFTHNGSTDTLTATHSSGSGIGLLITKGGANEGLKVNKTSGSGNAATIIGTLEATTLVKTGGLATEFLMADGTVSTFMNPRVQSVASSATVTPTSTNDLVKITAQAVGLTLANPTGTFAEGQSLIIRIKDDGTPQTIGYGTNFRAIGVTLPTTTVANKTTYIGCIYNLTDTKFDIIGVCTEA
jgi:hypothetical protein